MHCSGTGFSRGKSDFSSGSGSKRLRSCVDAVVVARVFSRGIYWLYHWWSSH